MEWIVSHELKLIAERLACDACVLCGAARGRDARVAIEVRDSAEQIDERYSENNGNEL